MKRDFNELDFQKAFRPMPAECRHALMKAASDLREDPPVKRASYRAALIAALIILATMAVAYAAVRLGWADYYNRYQNVTVPKAAQEAMNVAAPKRVQVGPMTFTFRQLLTDRRIALSSAEIHTTDGSGALYASDTDVYDAMDSRGDTVLNHYKLPSGITWLDAAKKLNLPLYGIRALIEVSEPYADGQSMEDAMWNEDGSIVYFNMPSLLPEAVQDELPVTLYMAVTQFDPATDEVMEKWQIREEAAIPASPMIAEKTYLPHGGDELGGMKVVGIHAEQYATGIYLTSAFTVPEGMGQGAARDALYGLILLDGTGAELPGGLNLSVSATTDELPAATLEIMTSVDELPDSLLLTDGTASLTFK